MQDPIENKAKQAKKPRVPKKITESYLHNSGLYYLERFAASSAHFKKVMMRKVDRSCYVHKDQNRQDCAAMVNRLAEKFQSTGLLDDESYARGMVISSRRSGLSTRAIYSRLTQKGLPPNVIGKYLEEVDQETDEDSELCAALKLAKRRRIGPFRTREKTENCYEKAMGSLARTGFSYDIASKALKMEKEEALRLIESCGY